MAAHEATTAAGIYISASSLGGFSGRMFTGLLADLIGWRAGFFALAAHRLRLRRPRSRVLLPPERKFVRSAGLLALGAADAARISATAQLLATYAVGFGVLFNFICTFTLCQLSSRRAALQSLRQLARRDFRRLSDRLGAGAVDRLGDGAIRPPAASRVRVIALWIVRHCADAGAVAAADHRSAWRSAPPAA